MPNEELEPVDIGPTGKEHPAIRKTSLDEGVVEPDDGTQQTL